MAQNLLRDKPLDDATLAALNKLALDDSTPLARVLALHTLASTGKLTPAAVAAAETSADAKVRSHALRAAADSTPANSFPAKDLMEVLAKAASDKSPEVIRQVLRSLAAVFPQEPARAAELAVKLANSPKADKSFAILAVSASAGQEKALIAAAGKSPLATLAETSQKAREKTSVKVTIPAAAQAVMEAGQAAFMVNCSGCHGLEGQGMPNMAPPLADSEHVDGSAKRMVHIVLDGLEGPVTVSGKKYTAPEILPNMPGFRANPALDDKTLANLLTYLRYSWGHKAGQVSAEEVATIRQATATRSKAWTEAELQQEAGTKKAKN
jgi:mono/diheme cytochrome c family protein